MPMTRYIFRVLIEVHIFDLTHFEVRCK